MSRSRPEWADALANALPGLARQGPKNLLNVIMVFADVVLAEDDLIGFVTDADENDPALTQLRLALASWDRAEAADWPNIELPSSALAAHTGARRAWVIQRLGLSSEANDAIASRIPVFRKPRTLITTTFEPWYRTARPKRSQMYWTHYLQYLETKGWPADSIAALDATTTDIVERLSDPTRVEQRKTKGLAVGYVQSGKTANFTGVLAKSIDAGYRMVIVLTGTIELLRAQTQRRLDMELVGSENIVAGLNLDDPQVFKEFDYNQDQDWAHGKFIAHGHERDEPGVAQIRRVTTYKSDYKRLPQGLSQLRFSRRNRNRPLNDPENLFASDAYLAVVKKNKASLTKLIKDLEPLRDQIADLPVLIIDDESDQATVDTTNPNRWRDNPEQRKRTAINELISNLMGLCPRAQYVGYTATPFANVFIDPDDTADLFPSNFLISLDRPPAYMGVADFHDLGRSWEDEEPTVATSNRLAFVRPLKADPLSDPESRDDELLEAIDAFVLSGAIKLYRHSITGREYRHHTMLVHESVKRADHAETAAVVERLWAAGAYTSSAASKRLEALWRTDFLLVCAARADGLPVPEDFNAVRPFIGTCVSNIEIDGSPVIVVNSDQDIQRNQKKLDFETEPVWRILVGGAQLSRGFTVQDLTVSYFRRRTLQADTMMQAGRWFGFRAGYKDLVRLYIRRDNIVDLYQAYEALLMDEEAFREELRRFEGFDADGMPLLEPWQIPPLVTQHLPWLRPTARSKMWNAVIDQKGVGGRALDYYNHPGRENTEGKQHNFDLVGIPLLRTASNPTRFTYKIKNADDTYATGLVQAKAGVIAGDDFLKLLRPKTGMLWDDDFEAQFDATYRFLNAATADGRIADWAVIWPQPIKSGMSVEFDGFDCPLPVIQRNRRRDRTDFVGSDSKHRYVVERLAGADHPGGPPDDEIAALRRPDRGGILVYLVDDRRVDNDEKARLGALTDSGALVVLFSLAAPLSAVPAGRTGVIRWTVAVQQQLGVAAVPKPKVDASRRRA